MNKPLLAALAAAVLAAPLRAADAAKAAPKDGFKTDDERTAYAYGYKVGSNLAPLGLSESEVKVLAQGLRDAAAGKKAAVDSTLYLPRISEMVQKRVEAKAAVEKKKGDAYSAAFAKEAGVSAIPNDAGWIKTLTEGTGAQPAAEDTVKVHYRGTLIDGTEFDSSYKRGEPATFPLRGVIPCWTNGVAQVKVGGKAKLVCPSSAAYGDQGHPPTIPGGSTLVFEVELLEVVKAAPAEAPKDEKASKKKKG